MLKNLKIYHGVSILFLLSKLCSETGNSFADTLKIDITAAAKAEHTDNLFFQTGRATVDDFISTLSPGLKASFNDAVFFSELSGRADILKYNDNDNLDTVDDDFSGKINYKFTPRFSMGASGRYISSSRPDYFIEETGLAVLQKIERKTASCKSEYYITEKVFSSIEYAHDNLQYREYNKSGSETNSGNFVIGSSFGGINENLIARLTMGYSRSSFDGLQLDSTFSYAGFTKNIDEKWAFSIDAGANIIQTDFDDYQYYYDPSGEDPFPVLVKNNKSDEYLEWMAFSNLDYKGEMSSAKFSISRTVSPAPERSGAVERRSIRLSGSRRITEDLSFDASVSYYTNTSDRDQFSVSQIDDETIQMRPGFRYQINTYFSFETAYKFTFLKNKITDKDATQNVVYCRFFAGYPVFE